MENYLYLLEFFVETITFSSNLQSYPKPYQVVVYGEVPTIGKMDVIAMYTDNADESQKEMSLNCGKSTLFSCTAANLLETITQNPFQITVHVMNNPIGGVAISWTKDFFTLLKKEPEAFGVTGPVSMNDQFLLTDQSDRIMGDIKASVKLSCFGPKIQTSFQLINNDKNDNKRVMVRGARGRATFDCQKMAEGASDEILPLTPLLANASGVKKNIASDHDSPNQMDDDHYSWMALFKSTMDEKFSSQFSIAISNFFGVGGAPGGGGGGAKTSSALTFDIVSLMEKPDERKYIDLRIKTNSEGFTFEIDKIGIFSDVDSLSLSDEVKVEAEPALTVEKIDKMLCKSKDCPAAKKFKEFGLGPLANTKGLGTVYGNPPIPVTYGLSQTYGVFDEYGPYGLFSKPKRPSDPFLPKQTNNDWASSCWKPKRRKECCTCQKNKSNCCYCKNIESPLRLTGGGVLDYDDVKSPFFECKEVMDQMDEVLKRYKKALGPCGKVTCPFAPNVTKESCKQMCNHQEDVYSHDEPLYKPPQPTSCTKQSTKDKFKLKGACGSPKCAYAKYKTGLTDEDAEMELQYLPSATSGKCGHPKCPYPVEPELPPIHWDCPDPLPQGRCKNPNCPYLPKEIKCLNEVLSKGPCGNFNCPFSPPPPCDSPACPFASKDCPYQQETDSVCENSNCPYAPKTEGSVCGNSDCPYGNKNKVLGNTSPPCPMMNPCLQNLMTYVALATGNTEMMQLCFGGPNCPYEQNQNRPLKATKQCQKKPSPCYVPVGSECGNPNCPYVGKSAGGDSCSRRSKCDESNNASDSLCENPECPYTPKTCYSKPPPCYQPSEEVCENPECPYTPRTCKPPPQTCPMPCPYTPPCLMGASSCPYTLLQTLLTSCIPMTVCPDGTCPYPAQDVLQLCFGGPECPFTKPQEPCMIEEQSAKDEMCANPSCPYQKGGDDKSKELGEGVEYTSDTRISYDNSPCTQQTCKSQGGDLVCTECPCGGGDEDGGVVGETEYKSETRISRDMAPCTQKTCQSTGGNLICDSCPCGRSQSETRKSKKSKLGGRDTKSAPTMGEKKKKKKRKNRKSKYVYSIGDTYPGVQIGHRECVMPAWNVPPKMGWLWNIFTPCMSLKPRRGWRPGAIAKTIAARIREHRQAQGLQMLELKDLRKGKKGYYGNYTSETSVNIQPKPTLHIKKHDGCYWITMNPLKDPNSLVENESPYMDCTPLQFKIVKNKDKEKKVDADGNEDYTSCFCGDEENEQSSSSDSELEIEFTPPAGIIHPERFKRKKNVVHCDTQYLAADFETKSTKSSKKGGKKGKKDKKKGKKEKKGKKGKKK